MTRHFRKLAGYLSLPDRREKVRADTGWFAASVAAPAPPAGVHLSGVRLIDEHDEDAPSHMPLTAAQGPFSDPPSDPDEAEGAT